MNDSMHEEDMYPKPENTEEPEVFSVEKDLKGDWEFSRRGFLAAMGATAVAAAVTSQISSAGENDTATTLRQQRGSTTIFAHRDDVLVLALNGAGTVLASGSKDNTVKLWSMPDGGLFKVLRGHNAPVTMLAISPDGTVLASVGSNNSIRLWSLPDGDDLGNLDGINSTVNTLVFSPDSTILAVAARDGIVSLWSVPDGNSLGQLQGGDGVWTISATGNVNVRSCASTNCDIVGTVQSGEMLNVIASEGDWLEVQLPNGDSGFVFASLASYEGAGAVALAFSPDGAILASASTSGNIRLWSMPDGEALAVLEGYVIGENWITTGDNNVNVRASASTSAEQIGAVESGEILNVISTENDWHSIRFNGRTGYVAAFLTERIPLVNGLAINPDSNILAAAGDGGSVKLWSLPDGEELATLDGPGNVISNLMIAPDGAFLVASDNGGNLKAWSLPDAEELASVQHSGRINTLAISLDASTVASAGTDDSIRLWDTEEWRSREQLVGHEGNVNTVVVTPDNDIIASCSNDNTIRLWSLSSGRLLVQLMDLDANPEDVEGIQIEVPASSVPGSSGGGFITMTIPCGEPIPPGATCICNCVGGNLCTCVGYVAPTATPRATICTCDTVCTCQSVCGCVGACSCVGNNHYWYPN